jgi:hypothetical protein
MGTRQIEREIGYAIKKWIGLREDEEDRRRKLTVVGQGELHRWKSAASGDQKENEYVSEQVKKVVSALNESTELGKVNNQEFQSYTQQFEAVRSLKGDERTAALTRLKHEIDRVISEEFPKRDSVLDVYEAEVSELSQFVSARLGP